MRMKAILLVVIGFGLSRRVAKQAVLAWLVLAVYASSVLASSEESLQQQREVSVLKTCDWWIRDRIPRQWSEHIRIEVDSRSLVIIGRAWGEEASALIFAAAPTVDEVPCRDQVDIESIPSSLVPDQVFESARLLGRPLDWQQDSGTNGKEIKLEIDLVNAKLNVTWFGCDRSGYSVAAWVHELLAAISSSLDPCDKTV